VTQEQLPQPPTEGVKKSNSVSAVESASRVLEQRIDRQIIERLEELSNRLSALEQRLESSSRDVDRLEKVGEDEMFLSSKLFGDVDKVVKLLERSDSPLRDMLGYAIVMEALQNMRMNSILMQERLEELMERRRSRSNSYSKQIEDLIKLIESRTGTQLSAKDVVELYKDMWNTVKEVKGVAPGVDEEKLVTRIVSEVEKRLGTQAMGPKEAIGLVKEALSSVKEIASAVRELYPQQTSSATPLMYHGSAPWIWHPDARVAIKEFVDVFRGAGETIKDIILAIKAPETQLVKASKPSTQTSTQTSVQVSIPDELALG